MTTAAAAAIGAAVADAPLRLRLDGDALVANWRWLAARNPQAACGAAVKADGYGLGAAPVAGRLAAAGCRDFYVATWDEVEPIAWLIAGAGLSVLHGVREADMPTALGSSARPVLDTPAQVARWRPTGRPCDVMVDTGMNRLGLTPEEARSGLLDGLAVDTLMSHLACADEPAHPMNERQRAAFAAVAAAVPAKRRSLANSAGVLLGEGYAYDLVRPGLGLYGGVPGPGAAGRIARVAAPEAEVVQVRHVPAGATIGYGATFAAPTAMRVAILNIGYADGYWRGFAGSGIARADGVACPLVGRVSMDLVAVDAGAAEVREGDRLALDFDLPAASRATGLSQYELLTGLGRRYSRVWE